MSARRSKSSTDKAKLIHEKAQSDLQKATKRSMDEGVKGVNSLKEGAEMAKRRKIFQIVEENRHLWDAIEELVKGEGGPKSGGGGPSAVRSTRTLVEQVQQPLAGRG